MQNGSLQVPNEIHQANTSQVINKVSVLHEAAIAGDDKKVDALLILGEDRNLQDPKHGNTPLHEAAWRGYSRCVRLLCALPPNTKKPTHKESKIKDVIQDTRGALHCSSLGQRNFGGFSALHLAAQNGHNQSCREILLADSDPDVQNNYGDTPLHTACRYGHAGATRILLSGKSDHRKVNLNGDTALHIAVAMGRRKLTKILLEAGSLQNIKNAQNETVRDIAVRKQLDEILTILNTPMDAIRKDRDRSSSSSKNNNNKRTDELDGAGVKRKSKNHRGHKSGGHSKGQGHNYWSPYGCHYSPDPRDFPAPKLETLPKEPLSNGEQYYLDLAGFIRKGPVGVGNTCYCAPFFRHLEERISKNQKCIRKYVHRATEKMDNKVAALALRTDDQIEVLTRSMITQRIQCENKQKHIDEWLARGSHGRTTISGATTSKNSQSKVNAGGEIKRKMPRCKSLEMLDETTNFTNDNLQNSLPGGSRSAEILDSGQSSGSHNRQDIQNSHQRSGRSTDRDIDDCGFISNSSSEDELAKQRIQSMMRNPTKVGTVAKTVWSSANPSNGKPLKEKLVVKKDSRNSRSQSSTSYDHDFEDSEFIAQEMEKITNSLLGVSAKSTPVKSSKPGWSSAEKNCRTSVESEQYMTEPEQGSRRWLGESDKETPSPAYHHQQDQQHHHQFIDTFYQNSQFNNYDDEDDDDQEEHDEGQDVDDDDDDDDRDEEDELPSSSTNTIKTQPSVRRQYPAMKIVENEVVTNEDIVDGHISDEISEMGNIRELNALKSRILNGSNWRSQVLQQSAQIHNVDKLEERINVDVHCGSGGGYEIKNSSIKTIKPSMNGVKQKIAQLENMNQGNMSTNNNENSESSEEEEMANRNYQHHQLLPPPPITWNQNNNDSPHQFLDNQFHQIESKQSHITSLARSTFGGRDLIPKDAYFHELPNRSTVNHIKPTPINACESNQYLAIPSRNRNPLPCNLNETELLTDLRPINTHQHQSVMRTERLLSNRKFMMNGLPPLKFIDTSTTSMGISGIRSNGHILPSEQITIDQAQLERDLHNDSGYSTKICGSSEGASPCLSGQTDIDVGVVGVSAPILGIVGGVNGGTPNNQRNPVVMENYADYYIQNMGASSLV